MHVNLISHPSIRLYVKGKVLGYKRAKHQQAVNTSLLQIDGVQTRDGTAKFWFLAHDSYITLHIDYIFDYPNIGLHVLHLYIHNQICMMEEFL
jgi:hypothetical protein